MWNVVFSAQASEVGEGIPSDVDPEDSHCRSTMKVRIYVNILVNTVIFCRPWLTFQPFQTGHCAEILPPVIYILVLKSKYIMLSFMMIEY